MSCEDPPYNLTARRLPSFAGVARNRAGFNARVIFVAEETTLSFHENRDVPFAQSRMSLLLRLIGWLRPAA